jgi:hypothetical protein
VSASADTAAVRYGEALRIELSLLLRPMELEQLDALLRYVFGCHGYARKAPGIC